MSGVRCLRPELRPGPDDTFLVPVGGPGGGRRWRLLAAGDWAAIGEFKETAWRSPPEELYGGLLRFIRESDLAVVNLECALGGGEPIVKDGPNLRGDPRSAEALSRAGFHVACLANNHVADFGREGVEETIRLCRRAGLVPVGAGKDLEEAIRPVTIEVAGLRVGAANFADGEEGEAAPDRAGVAPAESPRSFETVRRLAAEADVVVVFLHGGREYVPVPPPYWFEAACGFAEAGAGLVICHHPHVPQGLALLETSGGRKVPVCFSLGNFVFPPSEAREGIVPPRSAEGYLMRAHFSGGEVAELELVPYGIVPPEGPGRARGGEARGFLGRLEALSGPIGDRAELESWWDAACDHLWGRVVKKGLAARAGALEAGEKAGLPQLRNLFRCRAHRKLIDRAMERVLRGEAGRVPDSVSRGLQGWYDGSWPKIV